MSWQVRRALTKGQMLSIRVALFTSVNDCIAKADAAVTLEEREGWNSEASKYIDAYQAVAGRRAAERYRARLGDWSRGNDATLTVWPAKAAKRLARH